LGIGTYIGATLSHKIKADSNDIEIPNEFMKWIYAAHEVQDGLVIRRGKEIAFWLNIPLAEVRKKWALLDDVLKKKTINTFAL
jgi:hypothetical protein